MGENSVFGICQKGCDMSEPFLVIGDRKFLARIMFFIAGEDVMSDAATCKADPLDEAAGHDLFTGHIKELVFDGRTAGVDDEDFQSFSFSHFFTIYVVPESP
jgi:hypothetical protein